MQKKKKRIKRYLFIILSFINFILGFTFLYFGLQNHQTLTMNYTTKESIDYQVYLKENNFFETPYLTKGSTYISTLIDYINTTITYEQSFSRNVVGTYTYYTKAVISADKPRGDTGNYWQKEYQISEPISNKITDVNSFNIEVNNKIDYQKYNTLLQEFKKEYLISIDGKLKVQLVVESEVIPIGMTKTVKSEKIVELSIPLTEQSVDLTINTSEDGEAKTSTVKETVISKEIKYLLAKIAGYIFIILGIISLICEIIKIINIERQTSEYTKKVKKILSTYNAIIVNAKNSIDLDEYNVVNVDTFDELIDAHSELRMPINYIKNKNSSMFILINDKMAWVYELKKNGDQSE